MTTLRPILDEAESRRAYAVGLVCLGWEDAVAYVRAGEAAGVPVILQAGPGARRHIPIAVWGAMFRALGEAATVNVAAHLDHGSHLDECHAALDAGFTSVMYDGSQLSLAENIQETGKMIALAERYGASTEAEIGYVGYADGAASEGTDPSEAAQFYADAPTDCLAVSAGNVHLQMEQAARLDFDMLEILNAQVPCPLVLHGGSGVAQADRRRAAREHRVRKINLGTELRQVHGRALRQVLTANPDIFDRIQIQTPVSAAIEAAARDVLTLAWEAAS